MTVYTTVCIAPAVGVVVGVAEPLVVVGAGLLLGVGEVRVVGGAIVELGPAIGGSGSRAVWFLTEMFAITSAMTKPMTRTTAAPAAIHSQRGVFGPSGG
ncbi:hypothetical protein KQH55_15965, partial [Mycetohabitans sp. B3]|nr:hypothetical protein [Mycetohabitans sp. B3]